MALPASGPISMSMVNTELGLSATAVITLNDAAVRTLFGKSSGAIAMSDGYSKTYYLYTGVIDTFGYRAAGAYFDGVGQGTNTYCGTEVAESEVCCGLDEYDQPESCYQRVIIPTILSSVLSSDSVTGYYDTSSNSGFESFDASGGIPGNYTNDYCEDCPVDIETAYNNSGGGYTQFYAGIKKNGTLWSWGNNWSGGVGDNTETSRISPVQIGTGSNWAKIVVASYVKFAIKTNGTLWAWGWNNYGQVGDRTNINRSSPVQIGTGSNWATVSSVAYSAHAIKTDGTLWGWGWNGYGQLGDRTTIDRSSPVQIGTGSNWATVYSGGATAHAIKTDGTLWGWGFNEGRVGDGTGNLRSSPVQIGTGSNWASVTGNQGTHAIKTDGTLWGWGNFILGNASVASSYSPVQIGSSNNNKILASIPGGSYARINASNVYPVINTSGNVIGYGGGYGQSPSAVTSASHYNGGNAIGLIALSDYEPQGFIIKNVNPVAISGKAIFGYGYTTVNVSMTNLVSNTGVVSTDTTGVGTARSGLAAASYGAGKAIFGYGWNGSNTDYSMTNLVSNTGLIALDTTGVGTARYYLAAAGYGTDKAIFGYGYGGGYVSITNLVSNKGVTTNDVTGVGTDRFGLAAAGYGSDKAIFGYGFGYSLTNLVSNTGVVSTNTTGVGTARNYLAAAGYGSDKAIFGYGQTSYSMTNLVSNTGVVASDTTGVGTGRHGLAAASYGTDKALFGYGDASGGTKLSMTNLVSNTGVVSTDTTGVGTARKDIAAAGF